MFIEDYDPYGFMDSLETGMTVAEGLLVATEETFSVLRAGDFDTVRGWLEECDTSDYPELQREKDAILKDLRKAESFHSKLISKNPLKLKRRK